MYMGPLYTREDEGQSAVDMSFEVKVSGVKEREREWLWCLNNRVKASMAFVEQEEEVRCNNERGMCPKGLGCDE